MSYLLVKHTVKDYDAWKPAFDEHEAARRAGGSRGSHVMRNVDAPNEVLVLFEWDSAANARKFATSQDLRTVMQRAGVQGPPDLYFLDETASSQA